MNDIQTERDVCRATATADVVVVDDHRTFAELLALALAAEPDLDCAGIAATVDQGIALVDQVRPDIVMMDVQIRDEDGIEATRTLTGRYPDLRVVILTAHADRAVLNRASDAGACALLPKDGSLDEMLVTVRSARPGGLVVHPELLRRIVATSHPSDGDQLLPPLTRREQEVLQLLADGLDARNAAKRLDISLHTCRGYIKSLLFKLDAHSQLEAVAIATRNGLLRG